MKSVPDCPKATHPLKAWRLTQKTWHSKWKRMIPMPIHVAAAMGGWPAPTWAAWEKYPEDGGLIPTHDNMVKIFAITGGQVRPDHFYLLPRREDMRECKLAANG